MTIVSIPHTLYRCRMTSFSPVITLDSEVCPDHFSVLPSLRYNAQIKYVWSCHWTFSNFLFFTVWLFLHLCITRRDMHVDYGRDFVGPLLWTGRSHRQHSWWASHGYGPKIRSDRFSNKYPSTSLWHPRCVPQVSYFHNWLIKSPLLHMQLYVPVVSNPAMYLGQFAAVRPLDGGKL
jgi:hypothetical protein